MLAAQNVIHDALHGGLNSFYVRGSGDGFTDNDVPSCPGLQNILDRMPLTPISFIEGYSFDFDSALEDDHSRNLLRFRKFNLQEVVRTHERNFVVTFDA